MRLEVALHLHLKQYAANEQGRLELWLQEKAVLQDLLDALQLPAKEKVIVIQQGRRLEKQDPLTPRGLIQIFPVVDGG